MITKAHSGATESLAMSLRASRRGLIVLLAVE